MSQVANRVIKAEDEFAKLRQFFQVWIFVDPIDGRNRALFQFARDGLVRGQHEFFDQLVRFIVLDTLQFYGTPIFIDPDFYLWKIEVQSAMLESLLPYYRGEFPGKMHSFPQLVGRWRLQNRVSLLVREPVRTSNHAACKPRALRGSAFVEVNKH